jgi:hypothetical protein
VARGPADLTAGSVTRHHTRLAHDEPRQRSRDEIVLRVRALEGELAAAQARIAEPQQETVVQWTVRNPPTARTMDRLD